MGGSFESTALACGGFQQGGSSTSTTGFKTYEGETAAKGSGCVRTTHNIALTAEMELQEEGVSCLPSWDVGIEGGTLLSNISDVFSETDKNGTLHTWSTFVAPHPTEYDGCMPTASALDKTAMQLQNIEPSRSPLSASAELEDIILRSVDSLSEAGGDGYETVCSNLVAQAAETSVSPERLNEPSAVEAEKWEDGVAAADWLEATHAMIDSGGQNEYEYS